MTSTVLFHLKGGYPKSIAFARRSRVAQMSADHSAVEAYLGGVYHEMPEESAGRGPK
jgi:hypothetical protein